MITVDRLGKAYKLGQKDQTYPTFRDAIVGAAKAPFRRFRHLSGASVEDQPFWALKDVSFEVRQGEVIGIVGHNGAGKSTLLKILSRITEPTRGRAVLRGRVASLLEVGTGFHPELSGRENIYLNGSILGMKKTEIDRKFDEIVAFANVEQFLDTPVKHFSSGMYVRLAFAVAAHLEPEILIVDEVLAVGDAQFQRKCLGKMQEVAKSEGRTVLFVSHNMGAIQTLCDRGLLLSQGSVMCIGSMANVIQAYLMAQDSAPSERDDLRYAKRSLGRMPRTAEFHSAAILNEVGSVVNRPLGFGEPFLVEVAVYAHTTLEDASIIIGIESQTGLRISTAHSIEEGKVFTFRKSTTKKIAVQFPDLVLTPGRYRVSFGIKSAGAFIDFIEQAVEFEVSSISHQARSAHSGTKGFVWTPTHWTSNASQSSANDQGYARGEKCCPPK